MNVQPTFLGVGLFFAFIVWALLQPFLFLLLYAGGGRKVKQNDRLVCVFSKVNGRTLSEKIHGEWYV